MSNEAQITTGEAVFTAGGKEVKGFLARPEGVAQAPAVIVIHEWWGLNGHIKDVAGRFARAGYLAVAPDLYDGAVTKDAQEAARLMSALPQEKGRDYLQTVVADLRGLNEVTSIGVTGFCMGGTFALLLPCYTRLEAAAPFYGDVPTDAAIFSQLSCPVLFIGGARDKWITVEKMKRLEAALKQYGKEGEVIIYGDADHAFFNDTRPEAHHAANARDAWRRVLDFFARHLRREENARHAK